MVHDSRMEQGSRAPVTQLSRFHNICRAAISKPKTAPSPARLCAQMEPWCRSRIRLAMARPRPACLALVRRLLSKRKRVFDLVKDFGTSESPKSTRSSTTHWCPGRPGHPAFRHNIASSLRLHTGLPYDWTPRSDAPLGSPLAPSARRVSRVASRLPGTTRLRFALHGGQR